MSSAALDLHALAHGQGISEFGAILGDVLRGVPGAIAAVLCDEAGDPIDFVYRSESLASIDVQLSGSQIVQTAAALSRGHWAKALNLRYFVIESRQGALVVAHLGQGYVLTLRLSAQRLLPRALLHFEAALEEIRSLLL